MLDSRSKLLLLVRRYCEATGRSPARVATLIHDQGAFFKNLESGGSCTIDTFDKAVRWFSAHWPADLPWPEGVERLAAAVAEDAPR